DTMATVTDAAGASNTRYGFGWVNNTGAAVATATFSGTYYFDNFIASKTLAAQASGSRVRDLLFAAGVPYQRMRIGAGRATVSVNRISTNLGTAVAATGVATVTPGNMTGIYPGLALTIGGSNSEVV